MSKYCLEFILSVRDVSMQQIKSSIIEFAQDLKITQAGAGSEGQPRDFMISLSAQEPTIIFDTCAQFGRIRSVKVNEKGG